MHLRVGVLDVLGKQDLAARHQTLSDVAEVCLHEITRREYTSICQRLGTPRLPDGAPSELILLGLGKIGGREPNYHSDIDLLFLYETEGQTTHRSRAKQGKTTTHQHFFEQLSQRIIQAVNQLGPYGRLYEIDARLRPTGKNGPIAVSLDALLDYHESGKAELWERQALCKARVINGSKEATQKTDKVVRAAILSQPWQASFVDEILAMSTRF